jgi:TRAP-type transport system periplasmic protein
MGSQQSHRRATIALLAAAAAALAAACGGNPGADKAGGTEKGRALVLTMANGNGDTRELDAFAAAVRRLSGGSVRIAFRNHWRRDSTSYESDVVRDVAAGKADLAWAGARAFDSVGVPSFDALIAPLLIDSYALERNVVENRSLIEPMLGGLKEAGVVGLGVLPGPMRKPLGVTPLARATDYRGKTIALNRSAVGAMAFRALGARPVEIATGGPIDRYDGAEQQISSIDGNLYDNVAPYLTANVNLWPRPLVLFANPKVLRPLTGAQRKALADAVRVAGPATLAAARRDERHGAENICRRARTFVTATPDDVAALRRAVQPVYDTLNRNRGTRAAIARITAMRGDLAGAAEAEAPACGDSSGAEATARPSPIDGVYKVHTTPRDLRAAGAQDAEIIPENYGDYRMVLDRGRFTQRQPRGDSAEGTYTVTGDTFTMTVTDAAGPPGVPRNQQGEQFTYRWSLFRDQLTFGPVPGEVSPAPFRARPWRRIGGAPRASTAPASGP